MPTTASMAAFYVVLALSFFLWIGVAVNLTAMNQSDAAGNALAQAFAVLMIIGLWILLAILTIMAAAQGGMPRWAVVVTLVAVVASGAAAVAVESLLEGRGVSAVGSWALVVPLAAPWILAIYASWAYFPALRSLVSAVPMSAGSLSIVLLLALIPWPVMIRRSNEKAVERAASTVAYESSQGAELAAAREENLKKLQTLGQDTPLYQWMEFLDEKRGVRDDALAGIRNLNRRQADAEDMLAHGLSNVLRELPYMDLELTPAVLAAHKKHTLELATSNERPDASTVPYSWIANSVDPYLPSIEWMAKHNCSCQTEMMALEKTVKAYKNSVGKPECLAVLGRALSR